MRYLRLPLLILLMFLLGCGSVLAKGWKQREFIVTMWCSPPIEDKELSVLVRDNFNLLLVSAGTNEDSIKMLDAAKKNGIRALLAHPLISPSSLDDPATKAQLDALIDKVKNHPALEGYHLIDEPQASTFPMWAKLTKYLRERDPRHLAYINLFPTYANQEQLAVFLTEPPKGPAGVPDNFAGAGANKNTIVFYNEYLREYVQLVKPQLISYDNYGFLPNGRDGEQYFLNLALIRQSALKAHVPFLNIVQSCTWLGNWRLPNKHELRWLGFSTLAYGGKGLSWFTYWGPAEYGGQYQDGKRMPIADDVAGVNKDVRAVGNAMLDMESTAVYNTGSLPIGTRAVPASSPVQISDGEYVLGLFKQNGIQDAFMIMNRSYKNISTAKLTLYFENGELMEFSPELKKWIEVQYVQPGSVVSVTLNQGDGKLFKIAR